MEKAIHQQLDHEFFQALKELESFGLACDRKQTQQQGSFVHVLKRLKATEQQKTKIPQVMN